MTDPVSTMCNVCVSTPSASEDVFSELVNPLPTMCKDREFARNLIAQINGEGGRHNSSVSLGRVSRSAANSAVKPQEVRAPHHPIRDEMVDFTNQDFQNVLNMSGALRTDEPVDCRFMRALENRSERRAAFIPIEGAPSPYSAAENNSQNGIIGRWKNGFIRSRAEYCEVGDAITINAFEDIPLDDEFIVVATIMGWTKFKKVTCPCSTDGQRIDFKPEHFWERVE